MKQIIYGTTIGRGFFPIHLRILKMKLQNDEGFKCELYDLNKLSSKNRNKKIEVLVVRQGNNIKIPLEYYFKCKILKEMNTTKDIKKFIGIAESKFVLNINWKDEEYTLPIHLYKDDIYIFSELDDDIDYHYTRVKKNHTVMIPIIENKILFVN
jgi:hypothetical protein